MMTTKPQDFKETQSKGFFHMPRFTLAELIRAHEEKADIFDKPARFYGWVRRVRVGDGGKLPFIDVYDGTTCGNLMGLSQIDYYEGSKYEDEEEPTSDEQEY